MRAHPRFAALLTVVTMLVAAHPAAAQWATTYETFYLQAPHNWYFRNQYQGADRLFNAFDYGHAILYETLWTKPNAPASMLEEKQYDFLTKRVLVRPPRVPLEETAIEVAYAKLAPQAKAMFDWSHILHRQIYDVLADERLDDAAKDREVARLIAYYKTRKDLAFSSRPKSMVLMQEQPYSLAFRTKYPKFNGLIWAYHWMQVGLYEPLVVGRTAAARQAGVRATVARFWQMLGDPPKTLPYQMPMTAAVAPEFARRYPEAAIIFDNLHSMHDVVSDILANPAVPKDRKGAEIALAARRFRDDTTLVMASTDAWRTMAQEMGIENMGGPAVGFVPSLPTPTVTYGAVMHHDDATGRMVSMKYGAMTGAHDMAGMSGMQHGDTVRHGVAPNAITAAPDEHAGHAGASAMPGMATMPAAVSGTDSAGVAATTTLHRRLMADSVIHARIMADPELHRLMERAMHGTPASGTGSADEMHDMHDMPGMTRLAPPKPTTAAPAKKPVKDAAKAPAKTRAKAPAKRAPAARKPSDPHAGHTMPGMKMP
jgi:hypothetical protein